MTLNSYFTLNSGWLFGVKLGPFFLLTYTPLLLTACYQFIQNEIAKRMLFNCQARSKMLNC